MVWTLFTFKLLTLKDGGFQDAEVLSIALEIAKAVMSVDLLYLGFFHRNVFGFIFIFITVNPKKQYKVFPRLISIFRSYNIVKFQ